ncbi:hypothetical protein BDV98DRAFT_563954 [Pterulicium gracile]|uniref:Uncharacterized protein n=1 Tax=Pterulicium gracile TaxID=1884261 RepID=A0A5C3QY42_9AGAR|nr:hypothetical protein BDV98DRAFT_563954 [Pterula gracilis]
MVFLMILKGAAVDVNFGAPGYRRDDSNLKRATVSRGSRYWRETLTHVFIFAYVCWLYFFCFHS